MIQVFPYYKGENISRNPLGYANKANARKRMDQRKAISDFIKTLPSDYWFDHLYTYENNNLSRTNKIYYGRVEEYVEVQDYDIKKKVYIKDIPNDEAKSLLYELFKMHGAPFYERTVAEMEHMREVLLRVSSLGYYPHCWKDEKDFNSKYAKYVTKNVEFKEFEVDVVTNDIHASNGDQPIDNEYKREFDELLLNSQEKLMDMRKAIAQKTEHILRLDWDEYKSAERIDLYDANGVWLGPIFNEAEFAWIRLQMMRQKVTGLRVMFKGKMYDILPNASIKDCPKELSRSDAYNYTVAILNERRNMNPK